MRGHLPSGLGGGQATLSPSSLPPFISPPGRIAKPLQVLVGKLRPEGGQGSGRGGGELQEVSVTLRHFSGSAQAGVGQSRWEAMLWSGVPSPAQGVLGRGPHRAGQKPPLQAT